MSKQDKNFLEKVKGWAQSDSGYDEDMDMLDDVKDYSGKSAKVFNVIYMNELNEYKRITECLKRGSACSVILEKLSDEDMKATVYRIEGIVDAVKGTLVYLTNNVLMLLPEEFVVRKLNANE